MKACDTRQKQRISVRRTTIFWALGTLVGRQAGRQADSFG